MKTLKILTLSLLVSIPIYSQREYKNEIFKQGIGNIDEFIEFLSYPNDANFESDIYELIDWTENKFKSLDFKINRLETKTIPLLLASKHISDDYKTVLIYMHLDGQPVDPKKWNQENPFIPVYKIKDNESFIDYDSNKIADIDYKTIEDKDIRIFARASSDAKGPVMMLIQALKFMNSNNINQKLNLKLVMDFEEEKGSPSRPEAVKKHSSILKSDALLIFDGPQHVSDLPTLNFGNRGISSITLKTYGPIVPQHSGHFGNYAPNTAMNLSKILSSMKDYDGRVVIPGFYDGVTFSDEIKLVMDAVPDDEDQIKKELMVASADKVGENYQEAIQYPSLNVRGLQSGWVRKEVRTIVPDMAIAEIDVRLVKESNPERLLNLIKNHIIKEGAYVIENRDPSDEERLTKKNIIRFDSKVSYLAYRTEINSPIGNWASKALKKAFNEDPIKKRTSGGSIPISPFVTTLNVPALTYPSVNKDNNQHSPNENIRVGNFIDGTLGMVYLLLEKID